MEAMQAQTVDVIKRMKEITLVMQTPKQVLESRGGRGDFSRYRSYVGSSELVDAGRQFLDLLCLRLEKGRNKEGPGKWFNSHANIRAKAVEVVSTIVQNNPRSQQLIMEANGLEPLLSNFTSDPDVTACTEALGAISCGYFPVDEWHNKPGIAAFLLANGYATLRGALGSESLRFQRKSFTLIHYLLHENCSDCNVVTELGFPRVLIHIASSEDGEERIEGISSMSPEDLDAAKKMQLVDSLWNICYNEPSSLREKGLVLPGEDALPPDVASKHFEPPLRAWAANRNEDTKPSNEKKQAPLLIGLGPPAQNSSSGGMAGEENRDTST
ncbi:putative high-light-induced protein, chloroplastic-like [Capsicum annuum]|nr:putative high-light-induced protein, chloroplastic-like [Capsicum annuum]